MTSRFAVAKQKIIDDLEAVISDLLGAGAQKKNRRRNGWQVSSPWRSKSKASQTYIWLTGARRGGFKDYAGNDQGDAIDLVAWIKEGSINPDSRMRAVAWAEDRYGIRSMSPEVKKRIETEAASRRKAMAIREAEQRKASRTKARKFYFSCQAEIRGTPVETYLRSRGIDLDAVPNLTPALRFHPSCENWMEAPRDEDGNKTGPAPRFPAMIAAMVDGQGKLGACHYTFLSYDGRGKAGIKFDKLMFPETAGLAIRLTNGPSGLNMEKAAAAAIAGPAGVTEGIEDGLSAGVADPELRMIAAGSLPGYLTVSDHAAVNGWLIFKDNDWGKPQTTALFNRAFARFRSFGKPAEQIAMPASWGKDVNDALTQGADHEYS